MQRLTRFLAGVALAVSAFGCDSILGVDFHQLDPDAGTPADTGTDAAGADGADDAAPPRDGATSDAFTGMDVDDAGSGALTDGSDGSPSSASCGDSGVCVWGGILSMGGGSDASGTGALPDGGAVTVTDDGFESGDRECDPTGKTCVIGALAP